MGTQFSWFYDLLIVAIVLGITFRCVKRGFVSSVVGLVSVAAAFVISIILSGFLSAMIYENFVKEQALRHIDSSIGGMVGDTALSRLSGEVDPSQILIGGEPLSAIDITPDTVGKIDIDLRDVDLSRTGIDLSDIDFFGIDAEDLTSIDAGRAVLTSPELAESDLGTLIMAKVLTGTMQESEEFEAVAEAAQAVSGFLPQLTGAGGVNDAVSKVIVSVLESTETGIAAAILDNLIAPVILIPLRTLIFFIFFVIICLTASFITKKLSVINRIPVIGSVNSFLGFAVGVLKSAVIIFVICIGLNILITLTGNNIIFLNTMTIEESFIFKHIYNFDLISFTL
jgi:uncharacterized membrane protein required for colicin V production